MDTSLVDPRWKELYKLAGIAAIVSELVILLGIVAYVIWPYAPGIRTTEEILRLLQSDPLQGLVSLDLFLAATTDAARSQALAASDALLALFDGTNCSYPCPDI